MRVAANLSSTSSVIPRNDQKIRTALINRYHNIIQTVKHEMCCLQALLRFQGKHCTVPLDSVLNLFLCARIGVERNRSRQNFVFICSFIYLRSIWKIGVLERETRAEKICL